MHLRLAVAAATISAAAVCATPALAGPPSPPPPVTCTDACLIDGNYATHAKDWVGEVRTWATSPPAPPRLVPCPDACSPDVRFFVEDTKRFQGELTEWLLP